MKKQNWYALTYWSENEEEEIVGFSQTTLYRNRKDAIKAFKGYPHFQTKRGEKEGWKIRRVRV